MTIKEKKRHIKGLKIAWIGDGNNVCNSMIYGCALSNVDISIATPKGFEPDKTVINESQKFIEINLTTDPLLAIKNADVVVTDTYTSIHDNDSKRINKFLPKYQINQALMKHANNDAIFMHCLPAKRENEVTSSVIDGPQSVVWDEAENRLHTQKALLACLIRA
jgi:ornithine carbamoyltransferase